MSDAVDRGQAAFSHASEAANETAEKATQQVTTFASELEAMAKRNPLGTIAGALVDRAFSSVCWREAAPKSVCLANWRASFMILPRNGSSL